MEQLNSGPSEPFMMSGPQFGANDSWWSRNRSNVILAVIGVLIIAGGIYLYANYQKTSPLASLSESLEQNANQEGTVRPEQVNISDQNQTSASQATSSPDKAQVTKTEGNKITVKAEKGAGVTHLARKALKEYLALNQEAGQNITAEHKIYIEDYLQNKTGSQSLNVGDELSFDEGLIKEAIDQSQKLNENQLKNLHQYVLLVPSLAA